MRKTLILTMITGLTFVGCKQEHSPKSEDEKAFYALGHSMGARLNNLDLNDGEVSSLTQGLHDAISSKKEKVKVDEYRQKIQLVMRERMTKVAEKTKKKGTDFMSKFSKEAGVQKTESGLHYKVLKEGDGAMPTATDTVEVHYHGTLIDGTVFDSSVEKKNPVTFPLNRVIKCWTEGLPKIKVGGKVKLVCPPDIAYGDMGAPPRIPGGSTLVFDVELLQIKTAESAAGMDPHGHPAGQNHKKKAKK